MSKMVIFFFFLACLGVLMPYGMELIYLSQHVTYTWHSLPVAIKPKIKVFNFNNC